MRRPTLPLLPTSIASPMTMEIYSLAQLEAHAEQHFHSDFAKLPPADMDQASPLNGNSVTLRFGRKIDPDITLTTDGILQLSYTKLQLDISAPLKRLTSPSWRKRHLKSRLGMKR